MIVHEVFAVISEEEVKNVMVCDNYSMANYLARATYGNDAIAVDCLQYPCGIGDIYRNNTFYHVNSETGEETPIQYVPTQEQQVSVLKAENEELTLAMAEMIGGM